MGYTNMGKYVPLNNGDIDYTKIYYADDINWKNVDTVIMCESLEHILEKDFIGFYEQMKENLNGYFIVVNFPHYHPLHTGTGAIPKEHCRLINDDVYDNFIKDLNADVLLRQGSHLVLNKKI